MADWGDEHERLLAGADPARKATGDVYDDAWRRVSTFISQPTRRRRSKLMVAGVAAAVLLTVAGTAAAAVLTARTGVFNTDREAKVLGGPGEQLDPSAGDFRSVVADLTADIPFPSARAREASLDWQMSVNPPGDNNIRVSTSAMAGFVANDAICAWSGDWAAAERTGNTTEADAAAGVLRDAPAWPAVATLQRYEDDRFDWLTGVNKATAAHDITGLGAVLADRVFCLYELVVDLPEALPAGSQPCMSRANRDFCISIGEDVPRDPN
jgi:hypothetical protein